ncbi:hypothetical protein BT96DRAFT_298800 [Gymnopus androsaceus JB14]|uniref:WW domain-containing protein n=1 Tax=Gymnopus androsaceus JB14 TaxID=1447944 RepID=A0A6A4H220_9AGAR|nr:hypothetical protein BT96DRAFT_298800 [Gymnopus androsaceus JB14]
MILLPLLLQMRRIRIRTALTAPSQNPSPSVQMIHGLPPKPIVSAVPPMPPSNSSLTEATAMATRESGSGKGKNGGGSSKSSEPPLPPNWEVRHSQSTKQVYYYNNRTHQSTWERPSSHQPTREHHGDSARPSLSSKRSLSFDDRRYRPGEGDTSPDDAYERSNRFASPGPGYRRSPGRDSSPYSKHRPRSPSPGALRSRDSGRHGRPSQSASAKDSRHANRDRDRDALHFSENGDSDRHWSPSSPKDSRHYQRQRPQEIDEGKSRSERERSISRNSTHSRRGAREDREQDLRESQTHSSNHKHRSPSPHSREQRSSSSNTTKRGRPTRFGTPPRPTILASDHDDWVPDELLAPSHDEKSTGRPSQERPAGNAPPVDMYDSGQPSQPDTSPESQPRRKRAPLPSQSTRFREMSRNGKLPDLPVPPVQEQASPPSPPSPPARQQPSTLARDLPPHQRPSKPAPIKNDDSIPSSSSSSLRPRNQSPPARQTDDRGLKERREDGPGSARSADDSSSLSSRTIVDTVIRPGSGMYADREPMVIENDVSQLPKAPRAMDTALSAPRFPGRDGGVDHRDNGPQFQHHPDRPRKDEMTGPRGRGGRGARGRGPPLLSGTNSVPVGNRIGADGIPNGPARSTSNPTSRMPLSSANMIPVTNNRYAAAESGKVNEEPRNPMPRNGAANDRRHPRNGNDAHSGSMGRDEPSGRESGRGRAPTPPVISPPVHRSRNDSMPPSPVYRQRRTHTSATLSGLNFTQVGTKLGPWTL